MRILLKSKENDLLEVSHDVINKSAYLLHMLENCTLENKYEVILHVPLVSSPTLSLLIKFMEEYNFTNTEDETKWSSDFFSSMTDSTMFDLMTAANYMDMQLLLDLVCQKFAKDLKSITLDEMMQRYMSTPQ